MDSGHGEDLRARRHDLAHQLVAELDSGADQIAVALFEDAFFLAGFEKRFDIAGGLFFWAGLGSASEATEKKKRTKTVMGVMSQSSSRIGQRRRTAQGPRVR